MYIVVVYDIGTIDRVGQRISNRIFKLCKKFLHPIQKSVFEGELSDSELAALKTEFSKLLRDEDDSVVIFRANSTRWFSKEILGNQSIAAPSNML